jgi:hypothetical protein
MEGIEDFEFSIEGIEENNDTFEMDVLNDGSPVGDTENATLTDDDNKDENKNVDPMSTFDVTFKNDVTGNEEDVTDSDTPSKNGEVFSSSNVALTKLASALHQDGIITGVTEEELKDVDGDKLAEFLKRTIKSNEYADLGDKGKEFLDAIRAGLPLETAVKIHNTELQLENFTEDLFVESDDDDDDVAESKRASREQLIYNDLLSRGFSADVAKRKTAMAFKEGVDEEDAKVALESLRTVVKQNKAAELERVKAEQEAIQTQRQALVAKVISTEEILPGIKVPEAMRSKIAKALTEPTGRDANGRLRNAVMDKRAVNAEMFDTRLNYLIELGLFDEKPDLSIFGRQKMSSAVKLLEKDLGNDVIYEGGKGTSLKGIAERENQVNMLSLLDNVQF